MRISTRRVPIHRPFVSGSEAPLRAHHRSVNFLSKPRNDQTITAAFTPATKRVLRPRQAGCIKRSFAGFCGPA